MYERKTEIAMEMDNKSSNFPLNVVVVRATSITRFLINVFVGRYEILYC